MRISFDSNAWERIFDAGEQDCASIREALTSGRMCGFISEACFRIEAVRKAARAKYFSKPAVDFQISHVIRDGRQYARFSFGPDDRCHPGIPAKQLEKLKRGFALGVRLMRGMAWMGLPAPPEIRDPLLFVSERTEQKERREQRQIDAFALVDRRRVGKATFDAAKGWNGGPQKAIDEKGFQKACAEWADGEIVIGHIAYENDVLCTDDRARSTATSIFNRDNRAWLADRFGVRFATLAELEQQARAGHSDA